tara:strand:- start:14967 stop:15254 length:288 start_codon:yes stop_codon:yes gene_type:complete
MKKILLFLLIFAVGCTDAVWDKFATIGRKAEVKCYSGNTMIFWGVSSGKVSNEEHSDGYFARWKVKQVSGQWDSVETGQTLAASVSGNCIIIYED